MCRNVAYWLTSKKHDFEEVYIDDDPKLQQYVITKSNGFLQVPLIVVDNNGKESYVSGGNLAQLSDILS